jgi:branched-chain amino acid transport system substrate-binding protein
VGRRKGPIQQATQFLEEGAAVFRSGYIACLILAGLGSASPVFAQSTVYIPAILELSGAGAVSGTNFRDGMLLAIDEINAKGGILGRKIETPLLDTQSDASISRAQIQKVLDNNPYVILGPVFSGSVLVDMALTQQAEIPEIVGGEAAAITQKNDPYVFRTSFGQQFSMPKIANYIRDGVKAKSVAVAWVNNDFGKGGRDTFTKEMAARDIKIVADVSTESGQADFSADVIKIAAANAEAIFVYLNEEESARFLREARKQGIKAPLIGETTLLGQKVIDLAQGAAEGVRGHVGLTVDAPIPAVQQFNERFKKRFNYVCDHNGIKGYTAVYFIKYVTEKIGKFDSKLFAQTLHGLTISPLDEPGVLMEATFDKNGDIDRESFLGEVVEGKQKIIAILPKLGK